MLSDYNICKDSTISLVLSMCGGTMAKRDSSTYKPYFKDVVRNKSSTPSTLIPTMVSAYIMDTIEDIPLVEISTLDITHIHKIINLRVSYVDLMGTSMFIRICSGRDISFLQRFIYYSFSYIVLQRVPL